jgi:hypothetical protein
MALVDPNIAMSYRGIELPNQLAQYGQMQQIKNAQRQNRLADLQMQEYERARTEEEGLRNYLSGADLTSPETRAGLAKFGKTGLAYGKALTEQETAGLTRQKTQLEVADKEFDLKRKKIEQALQRIGASSTPQQAIDFIVQDVKDGTISMQQGAAKIKEFEGMGPEDFAKSRMSHLQQILSAGDQLAQFKRTTTDTDLGGVIQRQTYNAQGMPIGAPQLLSKTPTIGEKTAQGNLSFAQKKFQFEQENPGFEYRENADGTVVAINKRTQKAVPVMMDNGALAAPTGGLGMPAAPMPAAPAAVPTPAAGTPLRGKGTAMTDTQHNAAMFGGAMAQAQNTIQQIERSGTNKSVAVVPGLLTGLVNMVPFGAGEGFANAIDATFRADPTRLLGPDVEQQRLAQAQLAFATAYLRKTSGAAFGASEVANTIKEFFPLRGEPDAVVKQKAASRERVVKGMALGTTAEGRKYIEEAAGSNDPLGIR